MTEQDFSELADIILTLTNKSSIVRELEALYRNGTDEGYNKGHQHGYEECLDKHNLHKYD